MTICLMYNSSTVVLSCPKSQTNGSMLCGKG